MSSTDTKAARALAQDFFSKLRAQGYTPQQVIGVATELLDLVTAELREREAEKALAVQAAQEGRGGLGTQLEA